MANKGFTMKVKTNSGYVLLYPQTLTTLIENNDIGEIYKAEIILKANEWNNSFQQTVSVDDILESDIPMVVKILEGTAEQMKQQENAYTLLNSITGVYAYNNRVRFTCTEKPRVDFKVQVYWTR